MSHPVQEQSKSPLVKVIVIVLGSLAILGALILGAGFYTFNRTMESAKITKTQTRIGLLAGQIQLYQSLKGGVLPDQTSGLQGLKEAKLVKSDDELLDAWGQPLIYTIPPVRGGTGYDLWSKGKDGKENSPDDVGNWDP